MLDQKVVALAKAIRQHETGNRPVSGATGELKSRYQFLPSTWRADAERILGDGNAELTLENENKVAYTKIKEWKDQGYDPGQIASLWNSGQPDMYAVGDRGVGQSSANPDVQFNVPKYVKSVYENYKKFKPKEKTEYQKELIDGIEDEPEFFQPSPEGVRYRDVVREGFGVFGSVIDYFKDKWGEAQEEEKELIRREDEGEINKLAEFVGRAGVGANTILDIGYDTVAQSIKGLGLLTEKATGVDPVEETKERAVNATIDFLNTESGKSVLEIIEAGEESWNKLEEKNPSLAEIIKGSAAVGELFLMGTSKAGRETIGTIGKAGRETAAIAGEGLETTGKKILTGVEKQTLKEAEDIVSPKLTKKVKDLALKEGRIDKKGKYNLSNFEKEVAKVAAPYVKKSNTPQKNINNIMSEIRKESEALAKTLRANDAIFNTNQLKSKIKDSLEDIDDVLIDEKRLNKVKDDITELLVNEVETKNLSSLWEARKNFDNILDSKLNAFSGVSTIKKEISLAVRKAVNDFIVEKSPQLVIDGKHPFSDSMSKMRRLYAAEQNIANKILPSQLDQTTLGSLGRKINSISHKIGAVKGAAALAGIYTLGQALFNPAVISAILAYGSYRVGKTIVTSKMLRRAIGNLLEKSGKLLNPAEKKHLKTLSDTLDKAIENEQGFAKVPFVADDVADDITTQIKKAKAEGKSFEEFWNNQEPVYHGTGVKFDNFDDSMRGSLTGAKSAENAIWFTDDVRTAKAYSIYSAEEGVVKKAYKEADELEKIAKKTNKESDWDKYDKKIEEAEKLADYEKTFERRKKANVKEVKIEGDLYEVDAKGKSPQELSKEGDIDSWLDEQIQEAKKLGKDGVKINNLDDAVGLYDRPATHYAIFDSKNIKTKSQLKQLWDKQ